MVVFGVMEFGMSGRNKPKEKYVRISMKEIWSNLDGQPKNINNNLCMLNTLKYCLAVPDRGTGEGRYLCP